MQIDGISSIPPIDSISPVEQVDGRVGRAADFLSEASTAGAAAESSMAQRRQRKGTARSSGSPAITTADQAAAIYTTADITATDGMKVDALTIGHDTDMRGTEQSAEEYVATAPVLQGGDARGRGIELPKVFPEPIIDTVA